MELNKHIVGLPIADYENVQTMDELLWINIQVDDALMTGLDM